MTLQTTPAPAADSGPLTIEQAIDMQMAEQNKGAADEASDETEDAAGDDADTEISEAAPQAADDDLDAPETDTVEDELATEDDPALPKLDPPSRWEAEDKALFATLPVEAQKVILRREKLQQAEVTRAQQESAETRKRFEAKQTHLQSIAAELDGYVENFEGRMQEWDAWFAGDGAELAESDPGAYVAAQARFAKEKREYEKVTADKQKAETALYAAHVEEQNRLMPEIAPELVDPVEGPKRKAEMVAYLKAEGFTPERISWISAHEAKLAWKAQQYDRAQALAKKTPAPPKPKPKPAGPTAAPAGQGQRPSSSEARVKQLNSKRSLSLDEAAELNMLTQRK